MYQMRTDTSLLSSLLGMMTNPRVLCVILFLCSLAVASAESTPVSSRFDSSSANLARKFQSIKESLPHKHLPNSSAAIEDTSAWGMDYVTSIVKVVGAGFAIAILTILVGIVYGIIKIIKMCCCSNDKPTRDELEDNARYYKLRQLIPTGVYLFFFVWLLTGMIIGLSNNPKFTSGVQDLGGDVKDIGNNAIDLGDGLKTSLEDIIHMIPSSVDHVLDQMAGVPQVSKDVTKLGNDVNSTSTQVGAISTKLASINVGNASIPSLTALQSQLKQIDNSSNQIISQVSTLTYQIADKLDGALNNTVNNLDEGIKNINNTVDTIEDTADGVIDQASDLVDKVDKYVDDAKSYDQSRQKAVTALFSLVIVVTVCFFGGYFLSVGILYNVFSAIGFIFCFLLWFSGSLHFLVGMLLSDACPIMDTVAQGLIPNDTQAGVVLQGCLYDHRSILVSLNITAFNLSDVFDYTDDFSDFSSFAHDFKFESIDDYFANISSLFTYNLTAIAANITVANFGWNQSFVYDAIAQLNNQTYPLYYDQSNYTSANSSMYPSPQNQTVYNLKAQITTLIQTNATVYNETAEAQQKLLSTQNDINVLQSNFSIFDVRYQGIKTSVNDLETKNISNVIMILGNVQNNISAFFTLGNCSFLGDTYNAILTSVCGTMQPAIDLLTIAQFLGGIALIPMIVVSEVLSYRIHERKPFRPFGSNSVDDEESRPAKKTPKKKDDYVAAATGSPAPSIKMKNFSASVMGTDSNTSSRDELNPSRGFHDV